jgi:uncharacterized protein
MSQTKRKVYFVLGLLSLALGIVGVVLPIMPTAPFVIAAAFFFSESSEKWDKWLHEHPHFGKPLIEWEEHRVIRLKAKCIATVALCGSMVSSLFFVEMATGLRIAFGAVLVAVIAFIWSCPSQPQTAGN